MVRPFLNMTIKGALWYQVSAEKCPCPSASLLTNALSGKGENNVFQCHGYNSTSGGGNSGQGGGPTACGDVATDTGYACMMKNLVSTWRTGWSDVDGTSDAEFPFGIVSLAGGTSEGHGPNMGAFRYAQTGNRGWLPSKEMPNTFVAQAFDAGDPCSGGGQCCTNSREGGAGWACMSGEAPYTGQFMGGIHPRVKKIVGTRLAKAARAIAYKDESIVWTGPVLDSCTMDGSQIKLKFRSDLLKQDSIMVLPQANFGIGLIDASGQHVNWSPDMLQLLQQLGGQSAMEIQLNGQDWVPARPQSKCNPAGGDVCSRFNAQCTCNWNATTSTNTDGYDEVVLNIGGGITRNITAVRCKSHHHCYTPATVVHLPPYVPLCLNLQTPGARIHVVREWIDKRSRAHRTAAQFRPLTRRCQLCRSGRPSKTASARGSAPKARPRQSNWPPRNPMHRTDATPRPS
jgi:hypothetical protein